MRDFPSNIIAFLRLAVSWAITWLVRLVLRVYRITAGLVVIVPLFRVTVLVSVLNVLLEASLIAISVLVLFLMVHSLMLLRR